MQETETQTSAAPPPSGTTGAAEPEQIPVVESTSEGAQPSIDTLQERIKRLEANAAGSRKEWERERAERQRVEAEAQAMRAYLAQQQQVMQQQSAPQSVPEEEVASEIYDAVIDGDKKRIAQALRKQKDYASYEAQQRMAQYMGQAAQQAQGFQSLQGYMGRVGVTDANSPLAVKTTERFNAISRDPAYAFAGGNPHWLMTIAVNEAKAELATSGATTKEEGRKQAVAESFSEPSRSTGAAPGKTPVSNNRMYLTSDELKFVEYDVRKGKNREESIKRMWNALRPEERDRRLEGKRA